MDSRKCDLPCDKPLSQINSHILSKEEIDILSFRFDSPVQTLCHGHYMDQFSRYSSWHRKCSDPCTNHKKPVTARLKDISLELAKQVEISTEHRVIPGQKICRPCEAYLQELIQTSESLKVAGDDGRDEPSEPENLDFDSPQFDSPM